MGGKKDQGQRTKGNARPSSSIRSAEKLEASTTGTLLTLGGAPVNGYLGLVTPKTTAGAEESDAFLDGECQMLMKKMTKKDSITRLKALQEFQNFCGNCDKELLKGALPYWPRHFNRLCQDVDRRVREATHTTHNCVVSRVKRDLAPHLKAIMGNWVISLNDPHGPAATAAQESFDAGFTPAKQLDALLFCREEILSLIRENLFHQSTSELVPTDEVELTRNRITASSLSALAMFLQRVPIHEHAKLSETYYDGILDDKRFWSFRQSPDPMIRKAWFSIVSAICVALPDAAERRSKKLCTTILGNLDERDLAVVGAMWESALHLVVVFKDCWSNVSAPKQVMPKIWLMLRSGFDGNAAIVCPYLLPFISKVPRDAFETDFRLYEEFFSKCRQGMECKQVTLNPSEHNAMVKAYMEVATYITKELSVPTEGCVDRALLIVKEVEPLIDRGLTMASSRASSATFSYLGEYLNYVCGCATAAQLANPFFVALHDALWTSLETRSLSVLIDPERVSDLALRRLCELFGSAIGPERKSQTAGRRVCFEGDSVLAETSAKKVVMVTTRHLANLDGPLIKLAHQLCSTALGCFKNEKSFVHLDFFSKMLVPFASDRLFQYLSANRTDNTREYAWNFFVDVIANSLGGDSDLKNAVCLLDVGFRVLDFLDGDSRTDVAGRMLNVRDVRLLEYALTKLMTRSVAGDNFATHFLKGVEVQRAVIDAATRTLLPVSGTVEEVAVTAGFNILHLCLTARPIHRFLADDIGSEILGLVLESLRRNEDSTVSRKEIGSLVADVFRDASPWCWTLFPSQELLLHYFLVGCRFGFPLVQSIWSEGLSSFVRSQGGLFIVEGGFFKEAARSVHRLLSSEPSIDPTSVQLLCNAVALLLSSTQQALVPSQEESEKPAPVITLGFEELITIILPSAEQWNSMTSMLWSTLVVGESLVGRLYHPRLAVNHCDLTSLTPLAFADAAAKLLVHLYKSDDEGFVDVDERMWRHLIGVLECHTYCRLAERFVKDFGQREIERKVAEFKDVLEDQINIFWRLPWPKKLAITRRCHQEALDRGSFAAYAFRELLSLLNAHDDTKMNSNDFIDIALLNVSSPGALHVVQLLSGEIEQASDNALLEELLQKWEPTDVMREEDVVYLAALTECFASLPAPTSRSELLKERPVLDDAGERIMKAVIAWKEQLMGIVPVPSTSSAAPVYDDGPTDWEMLSKVNQVIRLLTTLVSLCPRPLALHWDYIMVTLGMWTQRIERREPQLETDITQQILACSIFELTVAVAGTVKAFGDLLEEKGNGDDVPLAFPTNLVTEWREFFSTEIYGPLLRLFCYQTESGQQLERNCAFWLEGLVAALEWIPTSAVENNTLEASLVAEWDSGDAVTPVPVKTALNRLCPLMLSSLRDARIGAYHVLLNCVPLLASYEELKTAATASDVPPDGVVQEESSRPLPGALLIALQSGTTATNAMLAGEGAFASLNVSPEVNEEIFTAVSGYLLTWSLSLELFARASPQVRSQLAEHLRDSGMINALAENLFRLMPKNSSFSDLFPLKAKASSSSEEITQLSCYVYLKALSNTPALIREWWNGLDKRRAKEVDSFTSRLVSPLLVSRDLRSVQRSTNQRQFHNMSVRTRPSTRQVVATYSVEEIYFELVVQLSENHPLGVVILETSKRAGVTNAQWSQWLLQLRTFLMNQNGSILDGLELWKQNIDNKFEGIQECYVCYYVLHGTTFQLPRLLCRTCKKKFHSACLYKWFNTSGNSTCPLCRSIF